MTILDTYQRDEGTDAELAAVEFWVEGRGRDGVHPYLVL